MSLVPELDRLIGIEAYATSTPPCPAAAKSQPEDFRVEEVLSVSEVAQEPGPGYLPLYRVEKRSIDTIHMGRELSKALRSRVAYAGMKDSRAVAVQYVTPTSARSERPQSVVRERFAAQLVGFVPRPISRRWSAGNRFRVTLRRCCVDMNQVATEVFDRGRRGALPNFFGHQRFGSSSMGTHRLGKAMVREDFEEVARLMLCEPRIEDDEGTKAAREVMARGDYKAGAGLLPLEQDTERTVARGLADHPGDSLAAIRRVHVRLRRLFVQAYQSYIFNRTLSLAILRKTDISAYEQGDNWTAEQDGSAADVHGTREKPEGPATPVIQLMGYAFRDYHSRFDSLLGEVLAGEEVSAKDFFVRSMAEVSAEGGFRVPHLVLTNPSVEMTGSTAVLEFALGRGQYASVLLREIIKPMDPEVSGLG